MGWEQSSYETSEAAGSVTVCANLTGQIERSVSVTAASTDGTATGGELAMLLYYVCGFTLSFCSTAPADYTAVLAPLEFTALNADQPQCIDIAITNDNVLENDENFVLQLSTEDTAVDLSPSSTTVTITNDDSE